MNERRMLNKDGAVYVGARAVVIPARSGTTREPSTRHVVVGSDHKSFSLDDGHTYHRLSGAVWAKRYSVDIGTMLVRQAYTEGAALFDQLWRSAVDSQPATAEDLNAERARVLEAALRAHRGVPSGARMDFYYDTGRAAAALAAIHPDVSRISPQGFWTTVDGYRRTDAEIAGLNQPVGPNCLTTEHGTCQMCRPVLVWAWIAERRFSHHGGDPAATYDIEAILAALDRIDPEHHDIPGQVFSRVLDEHRRPAQEASR